jgi:hypothetical protein
MPTDDRMPTHHTTTATRPSGTIAHANPPQHYCPLTRNTTHQYLWHHNPRQWTRMTPTYYRDLMTTTCRTIAHAMDTTLGYQHHCPLTRNTTHWDLRRQPTLILSFTNIITFISIYIGLCTTTTCYDTTEGGYAGTGPK